MPENAKFTAFGESENQCPLISFPEVSAYDRKT